MPYGELLWLPRLEWHSGGRRFDPDQLHWNCGI